LQLLAGGRAGAEVVRHGAERAEVSATFDLTQAPRELKQWLEEQSIGAGAELIMRRVVGNDGRSRAYLNGQSVPLQSLRDAGNILIDIHGQHEFQSLTRSAQQRELLDGYGALTGLTSQVGIAHRVWLGLLNRTLELESKARDRDAKLDLLRYQVQELEGLHLMDGELASLSEESARLANRGRLATGAQVALGELYDNDAASAHAAVSRALAALRSLATLDTKLAQVLPLLEEGAVQIREAARELERYGDTLEVDATRQDEVERRLAAIEELSRKHRIAPAQLPERTTELRAEFEGLERAELDLAQLRKELGGALEGYRTQAQDLSGKRHKAARALARDITTRMQTLGMTGGRFEADVTQDGNADPTEHGIDRIEFRVTANPGQPPRALAKVASGGELSRLSLAVQVSCAAQNMRCMVFDEVDSGIGGAVAEIVGRELRKLGERGQVLCVTHLPQVACQAHHHLRVTKLTDGRTTRTTLNELIPGERVEELARMLGGVEVTDKAREHARDMLNAAERGGAVPVTASVSSRPPAARRK
ncbi:MAG TPA: DNA repair protein RecN, partial [Steroidobacteraceae bacterium]|nr:DNA repair protein RecN [Steroidobacteraceae bacterium]